MERRSVQKSIFEIIESAKLFTDWQTRQVQKASAKGKCKVARIHRIKNTESEQYEKN